MSEQEEQASSAARRLLEGQRRAAEQLHFIRGMQAAGLDYRKCTKVFPEVVAGTATGRIIGLECDGRRYWMSEAMPYPWLSEWTPSLSVGPAHANRTIYAEEAERKKHDDNDSNSDSNKGIDGTAVAGDATGETAHTGSQSGENPTGVPAQEAKDPAAGR